MSDPRATAAADAHRWRFFRAGGVEQVRLDHAAVLWALAELDPKLWAALACPTAGLAIAPQTLAALDSDGDGRVRLPELRDAVRWVCQRLRDPALIFAPGDALPLAALTDDEEGVALQAAARELLARVGRPGAEALQASDMADPAQVFPPALPNGDGVVPADLARAQDAGLAEWVERVAAARGATPDRSGQPGIDADALAACEADVVAVLAWQAARPPGDAQAMAAALHAVDAVAAKVDDHFTRCRLAAFDPRAAVALDWTPEQVQALANQPLSPDRPELAALPLAHVQPSAILPLRDGINPAWVAAIATLREQAVAPLLGERDTLEPDDWARLCERLGAWRAWAAARPDTPVADWDADALVRWCSTDVPARLRALMARDREAAALADRLDALQRLLWWRRDLGVLLRNVVNFADFYGGAQPAAFQAGTLFIDQRECRLCLPVADAAAHAQLAAYSGLYLLYCQCERAGEPTMTIVAALTAGDAPDFMVPGRNGVFVDRQGRDWSARVVRVVENPISVREAFWAPYKRIARLIGEQVRKFAAAREQAVQAQAAAGQASRAAGLRHCALCRYLCRHRPGARGHRHGAGGRGHGLRATGVVADAARRAGVDGVDLGAVGAAGVAEAAAAQHRSAAGRQRLGREHSCPHQYSLWRAADRAGDAAPRGAARRGRSRCRRAVALALAGAAAGGLGRGRVGVARRLVGGVKP
ncbi:hypothetical protein [Tepidimonas sp.]|uniref:hypothetical protein n=1 Tax=Tepidimonas sp. TaxID=2002775 RepID=UPI00391B7AD9